MSLLCERTKSFKSVQKNIQSDNWQSPLICRRGIADEISKAVTKINRNARSRRLRQSSQKKITQIILSDHREPREVTKSAKNVLN